MVLKSCNRCGRYLPINIDDELKTLSFSLHCKKRAPCVHSTFRAYEIQNRSELKDNDLFGLNIEDNKVISYYGHQLECKACKNSLLMHRSILSAMHNNLKKTAYVGVL